MCSYERAAFLIWQVLGKEFKLYTSRDALQARLASLGAAVVKAGGGHAKQEVSCHIRKAIFGAAI